MRDGTILTWAMTSTQHQLHHLRFQLRSRWHVKCQDRACCFWYVTVLFDAMLAFWNVVAVQYNIVSCSNFVCWMRVVSDRLQVNNLIGRRLSHLPTKELGQSWHHVTSFKFLYWDAEAVPQYTVCIILSLWKPLRVHSHHCLTFAYWTFSGGDGWDDFDLGGGNEAPGSHLFTTEPKGGRKQPRWSSQCRWMDTMNWRDCLYKWLQMGVRKVRS